MKLLGHKKRRGFEMKGNASILLFRIMVDVRKQSIFVLVPLMPSNGLRRIRGSKTREKIRANTF